MFTMHWQINQDIVLALQSLAEGVFAKEMAMVLFYIYYIVNKCM